MAVNDNTVQDPQGDYDGWIELYNGTREPVSTAGMYLTDDFSVVDKFALPDTVLPDGGVLLIWADEDTGDGPLHANFQLGASWGQIGVVGADLTFMDSLTYGLQETDISYGRYPDGGDYWTSFVVPTPGSPNYVPPNQPPAISGTTHLPATPAVTDSVAVTSKISDDNAVASVALWVNSGSGFFVMSMFDDGNHHDGIAGDSVYGAIVPPQPGVTMVLYYVQAEDDSAAFGYDPALAPDIVYSYTVSDDRAMIFINEIMAVNSNCCVDEFGDYDSWIELYNAGEHEVDLSGMYLTDDPDDPTRFLIGDTVIPAGGYVVFWADEETGEGVTHVNFTLNESGGSIGLIDTDAGSNLVIDNVSYPPQQADISYGRTSDGSALMQFFSESTPGAINVGCICGEFNEGFTGNANCSEDGKITLSDVTQLIDYVYISRYPLCCPANGNINGSSDGKITLSDITGLIDHLYISREPTALCP
jgi:hypothetical protein